MSGANLRPLAQPLSQQPTIQPTTHASGTMQPYYPNAFLAQQMARMGYGNPWSRLGMGYSFLPGTYTPPPAPPAPAEGVQPVTIDPNTGIKTAT